ncbi:MAG: sialidase family protein [Planctomycetota bacterium]|jgi:hypothetical protein
MKPDHQCERGARLTPALLGLAIVLSLILGFGREHLLARGQETSRHLRATNPLRGFDPFDAPSAAGEMFLLRAAGLLLPPEPAPPRPAAPTSRTQPGADVLVNNPATDTPENTTQSETTLALLGNTICAGYNDSGPGGFSGLSRSTDLGATWVDQGGIGQSGDPVLAVHAATGTFYYAEIATVAGNPAIGVAASGDDCQSFGAPVDASPVASGIPTTSLNDKPWIAVDNTGGPRDGDIYVAWTRFDTANPSELRYSRSIDGGATFQNEQILAPGGTSPFGASVGVGPAGEVYVAWAERAGANQDDIRFRASADGVNFGPAVTVSTGNRHPGTDNIVNCGGGGNRPSLNGDIRMLHQAWLAVDATSGPFSGNTYVVWASDPVGGTDQSDVFFCRSTDGGTFWSAPVQLGAGGGATDQFEPFVAVGGAGAVCVAWYDRRNDEANNFDIDVYKAFSRDGGVTFDPIIRVSDVSFPVPPINPNFDPGVVNCYMGEYIAVAADSANFYYAWGDNRNILVTAAYPDGRPDPDVFFDAQPAPAVTASADIKPGSCPNPLNRRSHGVVPVALLGQAGFDVTEVDVSTVLLSRADGVGGSASPNEGPPGPHSVFADVATPFGGTLCDCHEATGDGITDLSMKFWTDDVVSALQLDGLSPGDLVELCVSATLLDGGAIEGCDCIWIVPPHDLNSSGAVGVTDLLILLGAWGSHPDGPPDFDGDGTVALTDLLSLIAHWGPCP